MRTPISIFAYHRPDHSRLMLQSLMECEGFDATLAPGAWNIARSNSATQARGEVRRILSRNANIHPTLIGKLLRKLHFKKMGFAMELLVPYVFCVWRGDGKSNSTIWLIK